MFSSMGRPYWNSSVITHHCSVHDNFIIIIQKHTWIYKYTGTTWYFAHKICHVSLIHTCTHINHALHFIPYCKVNGIETHSASDYIVTMFLLTLPWSPLRYQYPSEGGNCVTKILPKSYQDLWYFCTSIYCSFIKLYHIFGYHIETITNDRPVPSV